MLSTTIRVAVAIIAVAAGAMVATAQTPLSAGLPGCYALVVGPWTPELKGLQKFNIPPDTIQRFDDANVPSPRSGWKRAGPPIVHPFSMGRERAMWTALDSTAFRVTWSDGFTGAALTLFRCSDAHFGVVRATSDAVGPELTIPKATVVAQRIACDD